jgi:hypothetical protein
LLQIPGNKVKGDSNAAADEPLQFPAF